MMQLVAEDVTLQRGEHVRLCETTNCQAALNAFNGEAIC
jgi:hypothetical protein